MATSTGEMQVVSRAASILKALGCSPEGLTLAELVETSGLPRSTTHRVLRALEAEGLVARKPRRAGYTIGAQAAAFVGAARRRLVDAVAPLLAGLASEINETVDLYAYSAGQALCIHQAPSQPSLSPATVGVAVPMHCTAAGKAVLSALDAAVASQLIADVEDHTDPRTQTPDRLWAQVRQCQQTGLAWERDEYYSGMSSLAVVAPNNTNDVLVVSVSVPSSRFEVSVAAILPAVLRLRKAVRTGTT